MKTKILFPLLIIVLFLISCNEGGNKKDLQSINSLKTTIDGEINANAKYLAYAKQARQDSMFEIAALFDAAAIAEKAHADRQITMLLTLGGSFSMQNPQYPTYSIKDNLQDAIDVENYEAEDMYPKFITLSKEEDLEDVTESFQWALKAEIRHRDFFQLALNSLDDPSIILPTAYLVCPRCGNTIDADHPVDPCDICQNDASKFVRVD